MNIEIELQDFGDGGDHATISEWHFEEGDLVLENEILLEVVDDHESHEIVSPATGVLIERCVDEEDIVRVGDVLAIIEVSEGEGDEDEIEDEVGYDE